MLRRRMHVLMSIHPQANRRLTESNMPNNKKKKGGGKGKAAAARSNAANKDDLAGLDDLLGYELCNLQSVGADGYESGLPFSSCCLWLPKKFDMPPAFLHPEYITVCYSTVPCSTVQNRIYITASLLNGACREPGA